ncbi:MAG: zinc ribbon domain-containing protein [Ignavibacterium sp.]|nr:zinc ribbon domain-containing protein [Ignavibacterium sp.]
MEAEELYCSVCNKPVKQEDDICPHCGSELSEFEGESPSEKKYKALVRIKEGVKIFISLVGTGLVIGLLYGIFLKDMTIIMYSITSLMEIAMLLIFFEFISLFIDLKQNTRTQIRLLNKLVKRENFLIEKK